MRLGETSPVADIGRLITVPDPFVDPAEVGIEAEPGTSHHGQQLVSAANSVFDNLQGPLELTQSGCFELEPSGVLAQRLSDHLCLGHLQGPGKSWPERLGHLDDSRGDDRPGHDAVVGLLWERLAGKLDSHHHGLGHPTDPAPTGSLDQAPVQVSMTTGSKIYTVATR